MSSYGIERFENKIRKYKNDFLEGVHKMDSQSNCNCGTQYNYSEMISWTDAFLENLKNSKSEIIDAFDSIISVYDDFINKSSKAATDNLWNYLTNNNLLSNIDNSHSLIKILYRARPKNGFDEKNIKEYFHIPFSKRNKVKNQRFSVSGQPMLYFGSSIFSIIKEMGQNITDLSIAGFLPSYSAFYNEKFFSLTNYINDCIENTLPGTCQSDSRRSYNDTYICPNVSTIKNDIHYTVLMHLCTFPVEHKDSFISEYVIPQLLTTSLLEHNFCGVIFPSTKDYSNLSGYHRFSNHHKNLGIFVPYKQSDDINYELLNKFSTYCLDGSETFRLSVKDIVEKANEIVSVNKKSRNNNNDYIIPICQMNLHIEYVSNSLIDGVQYYNTLYGKYELEFYLKMLTKIKKLVV